MKLDKFLKIGLVTVIGSLAIANTSFAHNHEESNANSVNIEQLVHANEDVKKQDSYVDNLVKKYNLNIENIHIKPIYLKKGISIEWTYSTALQNADGSSDVVVILDEKGDLYNIDKSFSGKNKLTQQEKDLVKEQTFLHEYMHAYVKNDTNLFKSSRLSTSENIAVNEVFFKNIPAWGMKYVYNETQAASGANLLLIKHNADNLKNVTSVIKKMALQQDISGDKYFNKSHAMETHRMMTEGSKIILNDLNHNNEFLKNKSFEEVINYSKQISSDLSLDYLATYGKQFKISEAIDNIEFIKDSLFATVKDVAQPEIIKQGSSSLLFKSKAKDIIEQFPQLKEEKGLGKRTYSYENKQRDIVVSAAQTELAETYEIVLGRKFKEKDAFNEVLTKTAQEISQQSNFILAKKIANDHINKSAYELKTVKTSIDANSITSKIYSMRLKFEQPTTNVAVHYGHKM